MLIKHRDPLQQMIYSTFQDVTPVRLRLFLIADCCAVLLFCLLSIATIEQHREASRIIGSSSAPSVIAAHNIMGGALKMDMHLAGELLYTPYSEDSRRMAEQFEKWRVYVSKELVAAAKNITFATEQTPIERLQVALGDFEMQAAHVRDVHSLKPMNETVDAYRAALATLEKKLLPSAEDLSKANSDILDAKYADEKANSAIETSGGVVVTGLIVIGLLLTTQIYLRQRFRRWFNLPLLLATACMCIWVYFLSNALAHSADHLRVAKDDAYDSIVFLLAARARAYQAEAAQVRYLLDTQRADEHEKKFTEEINSIARFSGKQNFATTIAAAEQQLPRNEKIKLPGFSGCLADEFSNIRFPGEGLAALDMLKALQDYTDADKRMRAAVRDGARDKAIRLGLGYEPDCSKFSFTRFDDALTRALEINQQKFQSEIERASSELKGLVLASQAVALLIAICIYLGLRPRMSEYM